MALGFSVLGVVFVSRRKYLGAKGDIRQYARAKRNGVCSKNCVIRRFQRRPSGERRGAWMRGIGVSKLHWFVLIEPNM